MRLSILLVFFCYTLHAQEPVLEWINPKSELRQRFSVSTQTLLGEKKDGSWAPEHLNNIKQEDFLSLGENVKTRSFPFNGGNSVYITLNGSQRVYTYDVSKNILRRVDRTWNNGYNYNSAQFIRKDTLYSIGGYGFWHYNTLITFYDSNRKEWELLAASGESPKAMVGGYQGYNPEEDAFYSGNSELFSDRLGPLEKIFDEGIYRFDFKTNTWRYLGKLNSDLPIKSNREIIWNGKYFIHFAGEKLFILNPSENKVWVVHDGKNFFDSFSFCYAKKDTIICYSDVKPGVVKYSIMGLLKKSEELGVMYQKPSSTYQNYALLLVLLLLVVLSVWQVKKWRNALLNIKGILKKQELILLEAFLKIEEGEYLTSNEINDIIGVREKGLENQRRIRTNVISQINEKIEQLYNIANAIERKDHPDDKRLKLYRLQKKAYAVLLKKN
jgi:hypothetical protein